MAILDPSKTNKGLEPIKNNEMAAEKTQNNSCRDIENSSSKKMKKIKKRKIYYEGDDEVGYLYLPKYKKTKISKKVVWLTDLIDYKGPSVYLDFNDENELIGIEILD